MIQARKLGHIVLRVRDAQKSKDFYMRTIGLKLAHEDLKRRSVFLSRGETRSTWRQAKSSRAAEPEGFRGVWGPPVWGPMFKGDLTMARSYNVIDADGHVLEPLDLWDKYIDPAFRDGAPRMITDTDGKERLLIEGQVLGSSKGMGVVGAIGARDGQIEDEGEMSYVDGRPGGFDPHARIPDMDL